MPARYQQRTILERELDATDIAVLSMFAKHAIIDTTAVVIVTAREAAQIELASPDALVAQRVVPDLPQPSSWRPRRLWLTAAIIIGVLAIIIGATIVPSAPTRIFTIATATEGNLVRTVSAPGTISANVIALHFATGGQIAAIDVQVGQQVQAGQILAQLNPTALADAVTTQQQAVTTAQASYRNALVAWQNARSAQQSANAVAQDGYDAVVAATPPPDAQHLQLARDQLKLATIQVQNQVNSAQAQVAIAQTQITLAQTQLTAAQHALTNANLIAPSAGQISAISGASGATVNSADPIITLADLTTLHVTAFVNEADIGTVNDDWPVALTLPAFPQTPLYGTVTSISLFGQTNQGIVSYPVTIALAATSTNLRLFPGMTANITLTTGEAIGAVLVPNTALVYARTAANAQLISTAAMQQALTAAQQMRGGQHDLTTGTANFVLQYQQSKLTAIPVVTGITDGTNTVILAGLSGNQPLVLGDNHTVTTATKGAPMH